MYRAQVPPRLMLISDAQPLASGRPCASAYRNHCKMHSGPSLLAHNTYVGDGMNAEVLGGTCAEASIEPQPSTLRGAYIQTRRSKFSANQRAEHTNGLHIIQRVQLGRKWVGYARRQAPERRSHSALTAAGPFLGLRALSRAHTD
jgi:hypothetical protein